MRKANYEGERIAEISTESRAEVKAVVECKVWSANLRLRKQVWSVEDGVEQRQRIVTVTATATEQVRKANYESE